MSVAWQVTIPIVSITKRRRHDLSINRTNVKARLLRIWLRAFTSKLQRAKGATITFFASLA